MNPSLFKVMGRKWVSKKSKNCLPGQTAEVNPVPSQQGPSVSDSFSLSAADFAVHQVVGSVSCLSEVDSSSADEGSQHSKAWTEGWMEMPFDWPSVWWHNALIRWSPPLSTYQCWLPQTAAVVQWCVFTHSVLFSAIQICAFTLVCFLIFSTAAWHHFICVGRVNRYFWKC